LRPAAVTVTVTHGDITKLPDFVGAIVNCANPGLSGSTGQRAYWRFAGRENVDTAVNAACGPELQQHLDRTFAPAAAADTAHVGAGAAVRCPVGECRVTPSFSALAARCHHVIHAVGPRNDSSTPPRDLHARLVATYARVLQCCAEGAGSSVAVPAVSCGVGDVPPHVSATALVDAIRTHYSSTQPAAAPLVAHRLEPDAGVQTQSGGNNSSGKGAPLPSSIVCCMYESKTYHAFVKALDRFAAPPQ
jgi:hypothetical protein